MKCHFAILTHPYFLQAALMDTFFDDWPFYSQVALVLFLLALSGFFSMAETSMLSSNRHRLRAMASSGNKGAAMTQY